VSVSSGSRFLNTSSRTNSSWIVDVVGQAKRRDGAFRTRVHAIELLLDVADVGQVFIEKATLGWFWRRGSFPLES
jgi:hypothetical protein